MAILRADGNFYADSVSAGDFSIVNNFAPKDAIVEIHPDENAGASRDAFETAFGSLSPVIFDVNAEGTFSWYPTDHGITVDPFVFRYRASFSHGIAPGPVDKDGRLRSAYLQYTNDTA